MVANHEILEISSDEEEEDEFGKRRDWLAYLMDTVEKGEDSDEVVVVGEVCGSSSVSQEEQSNKLSDGDDDDDCLILDGDPDKPVEAAHDDTGNGEDNELLIVGEKGQIACRDYPHPRHLCARYPFNTNPHEKYCDLCHCYVCDTLAPCAHWGTGVSSTDHCHSNDKEEVWKAHRKWFRQGKTAPLLASKCTNITVPITLQLHKSTPAPTLLQPPNNSTTLLHKLPKTNTIRSSSATTKVCAPSIISQKHHQLPGDISGRIRVSHHAASRSISLSPGSSNIMNNIVRRDKGSGGSSLGSRFVQPHSTFKRAGSSGITLIKNRPPGNVSFDNSGRVYSNCLLQQQRNHHLAYNGVQSVSHGLKACQNTSQPQQRNHLTDCNGIPSPRSQNMNACESAPQPITGGCLANSQSFNIPLQPLVYSQPIPPPIEVCSQPIPSPTELFSQPIPHPTEVYSQPLPHPTEVYSQPLPHPTQVYSQPVPQPNENQITYAPENPAPNTINQNLSDFGLNWLDDAPAHSTEIPATELPSVTESITECPMVPNITSTNFDLDSWIESLDRRDNLETGKNTISSEFGFVPSQAELAEASMLLFDFENQ